jgi:glycosyltransferase involved in cell wall biosynthesis
MLRKHRMPRIVYLVTEDWYFVSHRLPMARAARDAGFDVHVATRVDRHGDAIAAEGFTVHPLSWRRGSFDPIQLLRSAREIRALYRSLKPDLVHHVAIVPTVAGSLAALGLPIARLNAITGLGAVFNSDTPKARLARGPLKLLMGWLLRRPGAAVLVQNADDRAAIEGLGVPRKRIALVPGSGVDVARLTPLPEPGGPVTVTYVGRLLESKGLRTLVAAHRALRARSRDVRLQFVGLPDAANPDSLKPEEVAGFTREPGFAHLGFMSDIAKVWATSHIAALPSRIGEGMPLSLLEAAACGRPLIATDTPGCRDICRHETNGLLVPVDDAEALAAAIGRLAGDADLRRRFGAASRDLAEREFSSARVGRDVVELYRRLLTRSLESW